MTDDNKTHEYYIVKWYIPPHKLQEDSNILQAGDVVCNDTYLNPIQQAHHCYTQSNIKNVLCIQHVLIGNIDRKNLLRPPNTQTFAISGRPYKEGQ